MPAVVGILLVIAVALATIRKYPAASFGILFFFLNHVVESSVVGLELVFEHRNYLPDVFLFFPVSIGIIRLSGWVRRRYRFLPTAVNSLVVVLVLCLGTSTYIRNRAWQRVETLWLDALSKAPNSARALNTLAIRLAWAPSATAPCHSAWSAVLGE